MPVKGNSAAGKGIPIRPMLDNEMKVRDFLEVVLDCDRPILMLIFDGRLPALVGMKRDYVAHQVSPLRSKVAAAEKFSMNLRRNACVCGAGSGDDDTDTFNPPPLQCTAIDGGFLDRQYFAFAQARQVDIEQQDGHMWRDPIVWLLAAELRAEGLKHWLSLGSLCVYHV